LDLDEAAGCSGYDAANPLALPSGKRSTKVKHEQQQQQKKILTKKEKKRLESVVKRKKKQKEVCIVD